MLIGSKPIGSICYMGGVPAVLEEFCWSLAQLLVYSREALCQEREYIHIDRVKFSDHGPARNRLVENFLGDWLLMLDCDHQFEPDLLARMVWRMKKYNLDVLSGLYRFKDPPCSPVLYAFGADDMCRPIARWPKETEVFQIGGAGAGCLLVRRKVFDLISEKLNESPFDRYVGFSEDHSFFMRLRKLGIKSFCAPDIECDHLRIRPVTFEDAMDDGFALSDPIQVEGYA